MSPFIRLCDSYIDHPKFLALSADAFRLWHEGIAFCRKHQTDGRIDRSALQGFRYFKPKPLAELTAALWEVAEDGFQVHDYLDWNPSKFEEQQRKRDSVERTKKWRTNTIRDASRDAHVPDRIGESTSLSSEGVQRKPPQIAAVPDNDLGKRGARLLEVYAALFPKHRNGARLRLTHSQIDWQKACDLCRTWDDERLVKLADIFLTTDDEWISGTDRSFGVFASKATWCDDRLAAWEADRRKAAR